MRQILVNIGYAHHGHIILVTCNDFCRVGHTAPKTKEMVKKAMYVGAMQACRTYLLLIDVKRDMERKGGIGWEERHVALLKLLVALFHTALLRKKQDQIAQAVLCCKEDLWARRKVVPNAQDNCDLFHLFATLVGYVPRLGATVMRWGTYATYTG